MDTLTVDEKTGAPLAIALDPDLHAVFRAYAEGFDDFDVERVMDCFHLPVTIWQDGEGHVFETEDDLSENIEALFVVFEREEIVRSEFVATTAAALHDAAFVSVAWSQFRADGEAALEFACRYTLLRPADGAWRIALAVLD